MGSQCKDQCDGQDFQHQAQAQAQGRQEGLLMLRIIATAEGEGCFMEPVRIHAKARLEPVRIYANGTVADDQGTRCLRKWTMQGARLVGSHSGRLWLREEWRRLMDGPRSR
jgi:hypothetical protein